MARCGCGGECQCSLTAGDNITVSGSGTANNPWIVSAQTDCTEVRACLTGGDALNYDPATGDFDVCLSTDANNNIAFGTDGCLFVPPGNNAVTTGCGLSGTGVMSSPLAVSIPAWPYPCTPNPANTDVISCDTATGQLRGAPPVHTYFETVSETRNYANLTVPAGFDNVVDTFTNNLTNPDPCRNMRLILEEELDVDFNLPPNATAAQGHSTDETTFFDNSGGVGTANDVHVQTTKMFQHAASVAPGGVVPRNFNATLGRGSNGATYNRIQYQLRAIWLPV